MTNIILNGCNGRMGQVIASIIKSDYTPEKTANQRKACRITFGVDLQPVQLQDFPVYAAWSEIPADAQGDVIIDFSHPSALRGLIDFALSRRLPVVVATTGIPQTDIEYMKEAAKQIPVFHSANMSIGICLLKDLVKRATAFLGDDFDIEIVERHHNQKLDAPSGTALALADAINSVNTDKFSYTYDRHSRSAKRSKHEIGISAVRGGNIIGDHDVIFAGNNEIVEISHKAISRNIFADGAVKAAIFMKDKPAGFYDMSSMLAD